MADTAKRSGTAPTAFVSYSWDSEDHRTWVRDALAARLRDDGVDVKLDEWDTVPGDNLPAFMESAVRDNEYVIIVCTPRYKQRSDNREGGVGYEGNIMSAEVMTQRNERKFIPVLRRGDWGDGAPTRLLHKRYVDMRDGREEAGYRELLHTIHGMRPKAPPLGSAPAAKPIVVAVSSGPNGGIAEPTAGAEVGANFLASGFVVLSDHEVGWLAVRKGNLYWPKEPAIVKSGNWKITIHGGGPPGEFVLTLLATSEATNETIKNWQKHVLEIGAHPGMLLREGVRTLAEVRLSLVYPD